MIVSPSPHAAANFMIRMADSAGRALALGCMAGMVLSIWRVKSVWVRLRVWRAVLCVALLMPFLGLFLPVLSLKVPAQVVRGFEAFYPASSGRSAVVNDTNYSPQSAEMVTSPQNPYARSSDGSAYRGKFLVSDSGSLGGLNDISSARGSLDKRLELALVVVWLEALFRNAQWTRIGVATYFVVTFGLLFRLALGVILSARLGRAAMGIRDPRALALVSKSARAMGIKRSPRFAESGWLSVPVTVGVLRPAILLPSAWRDWDQGELDAVISHEISHVARRDTSVDRLALLHRALFWFNPLSWYLVRSLAQLAEEASDEAALAAGADRTRYAETLLGFFSELEAAPGRVWWLGVAMAKAGQAEKRLDRILEWKGSVAMQLKKSVVAVLVMTAIPVVYVAAALRPGVYDFPATGYHAIQEQAPAPPVAPESPAAALTIAPVAPVAGVAVVPAVAPIAKVSTVPSVAPGVFVAPLAAPALMVKPFPPPDLPSLPRVSKLRQSGASVVVFDGDNDRPQFVISYGKTYISVSGDNESFGTDHPSEFVEFLQEKIPGDFIWFRRDGKSYLIRDQATIKRALEFFSPIHALEQKQEELGKQQEALGQEQEALGKQQEEVHVQIPDMTEDLHKLEAELKALGASGSQEDLGRIQEKIGDLLGKLGDLQSKAGEEQGKLGEKQGALGEKQGKLGEQQGELGSQEEEIFKDASRQMKTLLDDAITQGVAKPD